MSYFTSFSGKMTHGRQDYWKLVFVAGLCSVGIYLIYCTMQYYTQVQPHKMIKSKIKESKKTVKTILLWNSFFSEKHFGFGTGQQPFEDLGCAVSSCSITDRMDGQNIKPEGFDAILFHMVVGTVPLAVPPKRKPHQRYVFFTLESPATNSYDLKPYNDFFNWTMTYRRDSDIWRPYGFLAEKEYAPAEPPDPSIPVWRKPVFGRDVLKFNISEKTKLVAWFVSQCQTPSQREQYVAELSKFIPVDVYGNCGNLKCDRRNESKCNELLRSTYKFYLAFENSLCNDYVTEKFFRALRYNVVPIVYGGANYHHIAPPMSYINVEDFDTPKKLAKFLLHLDKNPQEYRKYFWWTSYYKVNQYFRYAFCKLCEKLHKPELPLKNYAIEKWWGDTSSCDKQKSVM
ncbi:alpha-(1,3)-fucosyltransferase C-like isoform X2 [Periplaneta americana]|uniref:alpha-(1,3)-fucosyltransferase C-like isoform X2 n=1 Tax=Periplaneta americana TaxID=6978 RepID=UPI0037E891FF